MKIKYTKLSNGEYQASIDGKTVGVVSKVESASHSYWDLSPSVVAQDHGWTPRDFGWSSWDKTRDGAVTQYFAAHLYDGVPL